MGGAAVDSVFLLLGLRKASDCLPDPPPLPPRGQGWPGQALGSSPGEKEAWGGAARTVCCHPWAVHASGTGSVLSSA